MSVDRFIHYMSIKKDSMKLELLSLFLINLHYYFFWKGINILYYFTFSLKFLSKYEAFKFPALSILWESWVTCNIGLCFYLFYNSEVKLTVSPIIVFCRFKTVFAKGLSETLVTGMWCATNRNFRNNLLLLDRDDKLCRNSALFQQEDDARGGARFLNFEHSL